MLQPFPYRGCRKLHDVDKKFVFGKGIGTFPFLKKLNQKLTIRARNDCIKSEKTIAFLLAAFSDWKILHLYSDQSILKVYPEN